MCQHSLPLSTPDYSKILVAVIQEPTKAYKRKNDDFLLALVNYFEDAECTQFDHVEPTKVITFKRGVHVVEEETLGIVVLGLEDLAQFPSDVWMDEVHKTMVRFQKVGDDEKVRQAFGLTGPRADEDEDEEQDDEETGDEKESVEPAAKQAPRPSSRTLPKKSGASSCTKKKKQDQNADGGLVEETPAWEAKAESRVDAEQEQEDQDLSEESSADGDGPLSSRKGGNVPMTIMEDG